MASSNVTFNFQDKVVIVTGGNSGIGLATATQFLDAGAKVAVLDIRPSPDATSNEKRLEFVCDVGVEKDAEKAIAQVLERWGTIDVLCNVAGVTDAMDRISETSTSMWERCFKVNVNGPFYLMRACTKHFLSKPKTEPVTVRGAIVNVCSTAVKSIHAGAAYTASKHAILGLTRSTAWMYAKEGIKCNAVLPGGVLTNIVANSGVGEAIRTAPGMAVLMGSHQIMPGLAEAADVARAILFVASNSSMNGAELTVDQGWSVA